MPPTVLNATDLAAFRTGLQVAMDGASGLDDAARVDAIRALEELACTLSAAQAALAAELDESQRATHEAAGVPAVRQGEGVASMVALARRESPHRGQRHLSLARIVRRELPHTWAAWKSGRITEWRATLIARETACLTLEDRRAVDRHLACDPDALESMSDRRVVQLATTEANRLDPESQVARRRRAESERRVSMRPAPDTMAWLSALLPVKDAVAAYAALSKGADSSRSAGDPRTRGQLMADALVAGVTGSDTSSHQVALNLVMPHDALFGGSDDPAHLADIGPIPAELAREIVAGAVEGGEVVWLRRLYASPATGELIGMESRSRLFPARLARFIRLRDQSCRTPWCDAPIRDIDHVRPHSAGGPTSTDNGQGLCQACNHAKQAPRWRARPGPDGSITTTTPTGHTHRSRAPALATVTRKDLPALTVDYVLAG